jgi:predicted  nucleic acid-binding Zn-ribbon protein
MTKEQHLEDLREQYIYLSRLYLQKLQEGKKIRELSDLTDTIATLVKEIETMEDEISSAE